MDLCIALSVNQSCLRGGRGRQPSARACEPAHSVAPGALSSSLHALQRTSQSHITLSLSMPTRQVHRAGVQAMTAGPSRRGPGGPPATGDRSGPSGAPAPGRRAARAPWRGYARENRWPAREFAFSLLAKLVGDGRRCSWRVPNIFAAKPLRRRPAQLPGLFGGLPNCCQGRPMQPSQPPQPIVESNVHASPPVAEIGSSISEDAATNFPNPWP